MSIPIESEIRSRVEAFAAEIIALVRSSAMDVVERAIGGTGGARRGKRGGIRTAPSSLRAKGMKRDPREIESLAEKLGVFIKKNPGQRIEQIGKGLGTSTKDLVLPVKKLLAAKKISTKGHKRSTKYFPR